MASRVICEAKPARSCKDKDRCGIELRPVDLGVPSGPKWGHAGYVRWTHWPVPKVAT